MAIGDAAVAAGYPLVPDTGEEGRVRWGAREINRTRDLLAAVKALIPGSKAAYRTASGIQSGKFSTHFQGVGAKTGTLIFPTPFTTAPVVIMTVQAGSNFDVNINMQGCTTTAASWRAFQNVGSAFVGDITVHWSAIGNY